MLNEGIFIMFIMVNLIGGQSLEHFYMISCTSQQRVPLVPSPATSRLSFS